MARSTRRGAIGIREIAARAGVSLGTVSHVLNHPERVRPDTRARVEKVMTELSFVRNESARALRAGRSHTVGYVLLDVGNPFFTDVAAGAQQVTEAADLSLFMCHSENLAERELAYLQRLEQQRVAGILITPVDPDHPSLTEVVERGTPLVVVDRTPRADTHCSVAVDDVLGGRLAAQHLVEAGHHTVGFVGGPGSIGQVHDRRDGVVGALEDAGATLVDLTTEALSLSEGRRAGEQLAGLSSENRPTAAVCANDLLALGLLQHCVSIGLRVPEDLAIVGYDDIDFAAAATVPLTSVRQPRQQLGEAAARLLLQEAQDAGTTHRHEKVTFAPQLIARESTRTRQP